METNLWWLIFSMAAGIGFFGSLLLLTGFSRRKPGTRALGALLFIFSINLVHYVLFWSQQVSVFPHLSGIWQISNYLYGPLMLLFILGERQLKRLIFLSFTIPAIILLIAWLPFGFSSTVDKVNWLTNSSPFDSSFLPHRRLLYLLHPLAMIGGQVFFVLFFFWKTDKYKGNERWLKNLVAGLFAVFVLSEIIYYLLIQLPSFKVEWDYMISLTMTLSIFTIVGLAFKSPSYFFVVHKKTEPKYQTSPLSKNQSSALALKIQEYVEENELFLEPDLRLPALASSLQLNNQQLSQAINEHFGFSFSEWINKYRVNHACNLLTAEEVTAKEVAFQSGFNSLSTFYQAFKKEKGITPAEFGKNVFAG